MSARNWLRGPGGISMPSRIQAVVLVSRLDLPTLQALAYAKATRPDTLTALTVAPRRRRFSSWSGSGPERDIPDTAYRRRRTVPRYHRPSTSATWPSFVPPIHASLIVVYIPEYVVGHPWEQLLHNQSALRLKARLLF